MPIDRRIFPADGTLGAWSAPDGWQLRTYRRPAKRAARGAILWLGGRGDFFEKYLEAFDGWACAGWEVTSFDWRGQGGSGRMAADPLLGHIDDFSTWIDDLAAFWSDWVARAPAPHVVMGHSMGGHLVLRALAQGRIAPARAVLVAPMLGFDAGGLPFGVAKRITILLGRLFGDRRPAWSGNERPASSATPRQALLTHDDARYADELWWRSTDPSLALGPPSWAWLSAAYRSIDFLNRADSVASISVPVLLLCAEHDRLVSAAATRDMAARMPAARLLSFGAESAHEILRERDPVRQRALAAIEEFLTA